MSNITSQFVPGKVLAQNGGVGRGTGTEVTGTANILARLGLTLDLHPPNVTTNGMTNGTTNGAVHHSAHSNAMHLSKEHVVELKEEDERRTSPDTCSKKMCLDQEDDDCDEMNKAHMTNSATQTQAASPGTPMDPQNVAAAGEKEAAATASLYHSAWPPMDASLWHSGPSSLGGPAHSNSSNSFHQDNPGFMSASTSVASGPLSLSGIASRRAYSQQQLGAKVEMVYGLLSMLGTHDRQDMSRTLLAMSSSPDSCVAMRQSGCLPLLVQLLHSGEQDAETRSRAAQALHNMVHAHPDDKRGRREARVLKLLEQIRLYCDSLQDGKEPTTASPSNEETDKHPGPTIAALMKLSFDEEHRHAMCQLGGLHAIAQLIQVDHEAHGMHGNSTDEQNCVTLRRYAGMALTNLTFGDGTNKALLCSFRPFMRALVAQLASSSEDLRQVTASVLRNLSWRADSQSKQALREVGAVTALMCAAIEAQKESTLKSVLSALWNLSAHCSLNKVDICAVEGALAFLVQMLSYKAPSKTLAIIENAGGILRNISSHVAVREDYRAVLREHNCLQVLLQQLKSPSLTVVSNACGTLWNLSARCQEDQRALWALGAPAMLRSLVHSKHKMISMGSSATLKNLLSAKPENDDSCFRHLDSTARSLGLQSLPGLYARKQKALEQELDQTLAETCDNIEPSTSPSTSTVGLRDDKFVFSLTERDIYRHRSQQQQQKPGHKMRSSVVSHSDSKESVTSTHSDSVYERLARMGTGTMEVSPISETRVFHPPVSLRDETKLHASLSDSDRIGSELKREKTAMSDRKFLQRYNNNLMDANGKKVNGEACVSADQNQNSVSVNQIEQGMASMNVTEAPAKSFRKHAWEETTTSCEGTQPLSTKEELSSVSDLPEKDEAVETSQPLNNNNNIQPVNGTSHARSSTAQGKIPQSPSFTATRNKYLEAGLEEDLESPAPDRPIDFARRYPAESEATADTSAPNQKGAVSNKETPVVYGDYAETDLDQPTDYSLQYGEEDDLSDFEAPEPTKRGAAEFFSGPVPISIHEDTVKTYCTEGTPYETPYNFSTATSLSDLRIEPTVKEENAEELKAEAQNESTNLSDICSLPEIKDESRQSLEPTISVIESGSISPAEKPVQFCEEGTPGVCLSRFSSLNSLDKPDEGVDVVDGKPISNDADISQEISQPVAVHSSPGTPPLDQVKEHQPADREASKIVPLNCEQQYAEETPLMFSRASSLGSLSSYEQQSILDDRSSVVSEFSRLTSGVVSPSELPDSPSQLVPPSPRHTKAPIEFTNRLSEEGATPLRVPTARFAGSTRPLAHPILEKDAGVFEDHVAAYKVEDTPVEFSRATSLSSLSMDDEPRDVKDGPSKSARSSIGREEGVEKADVEKELALVSEGEEEEDEDMLAACINIGMQNSRSKQVPSQTPAQAAQQPQQQQVVQPQLQPQQPKPSGLRRPVATSNLMLRRPLITSKLSGIPMPTGIPIPTGIPVSVKVSPVTRRVQSPAMSSTPVRSHSAPGKSANESSGACEDSMYRYCTEGTPANISHAGSHSDLSVLSFPTEGDEERQHDLTGTELSDDSSTFSGDNENILAECIQSGMPKAKTDSSGHTSRQPLSSPANVVGNSKRASVPNTSLATRRVASASPTGLSKTPRSHMSQHPISPNRNPTISPQRKSVITSSPQRTYPQASPQRSPQRSLAGPRKVASSAPKAAARPGVRPPTATPSSSPANSSHPGGTSPRQRLTGGARIVRAVNRNVNPVGRGTPESPGVRQLPQAAAANDEMVLFASEDSPCNFSSRSSLSDLTINSSECGLVPGVAAGSTKLPVHHLPSEGPASDSALRFATEDTPVEGSYAPSLSSLGLGDDDHDVPEIDVNIIRDAPNLRTLLRMPEGSSSDDLVAGAASAAAMVSSDGSDKLSDRMSDKQQPNPSQSSASEEVLTILSRNASLSSLSVESLGSCEPTPSEQALLEQCINSGMPKSRAKGGESAPKKVVSKLPCPVERASRPRTAIVIKQNETVARDSNALVNGVSVKSQEPWREGPMATDQQHDRERRRFNSEAQSDSGGSDKAPEEMVPLEKKFNFVEDVDVMKASATSNGTWADDSSPNDISYPSISISAPIPASIRSDNYRELSDLVEENNDSASEAQDLPSLTDSWMLEAEATKVATAVMGLSLNSLDSILPPSEMGSLVSLSQSYSGRSLPHTLLNRNSSRKKSLPAALNNAAGIDSSIEFSMSSSCTSHLENMKAPSVLDEMGDSENSFMSIASITSEAADLTMDVHRDGSIGDATYELIRPAAKVMADAFAKSAFQHLSQLETQDPPSTFQEITELSTDQDLTLEPGTETIASDSEMNDEVADSKTMEAPDLPCDSQHTTPAHSATASSAESTPRKESRLKKRVTPRQRREVARDRYQTYTISSPTAEQKVCAVTTQSEIQKEKVPSPPLDLTTDVSPTPKQRRQMTRERYQTYTISSGTDKSNSTESSPHEVRKSATVGDVPSNTEALKKKTRTTPKQRRQEDRDRFRTRTLEKDSIAGGQ